MRTGGELTSTFAARPWHFFLLSLFLHVALLLPFHFQAAPRLSGLQDTVLSVTFSSAGIPQDKASDVATRERTRPASRIEHKTAAMTTAAASLAPSLPATGITEAPDEHQAETEAAQSRELPPVTARAQMQALLLSDLQRHFEYPPLARIRGWQGMVWLSVTVKPDGILDAIYVAKSSGYALLDRSAIKSMQRVGQVAEAGRWLRGEPIELPLPIVYQLTD